MLKQYKYYFLLHSVILIWGFTGVIGKHLDFSGMESMPIVIYRMLIGWVTLMIFMLIIKKAKEVQIEPKIKSNIN